MYRLAPAKTSLESACQTLTDNGQCALCSVQCQAVYRPSLASPALTPSSGNLPNHGAAALRRDVAYFV